MKQICKEEKKGDIAILLGKGLPIKEQANQGVVTFYEEEMVHSLLYKKMMKKYRKFVSQLFVLFSVDDESGTAAREALNQVQKFRLELNNKYRKFLKEHEQQKLEKELYVMEQEALRKVYIIENFHTMQQENTQNKSR